jgi:flavin reductase (DIM6/NTAB) family NADH-FMN oxidoreductase RutF
LKEKRKMSKVTVDYTDYFAGVIKRMREDGLLMVTTGADGKPNVMTIGWGTVGILWSKPVFVVLVRPSRYTYSRLEEVNEFTVNVPPEELAKAALHCGTFSGRDNDKFKDMGLTAISGKMVKVPIIEECIMHYECRVVHENDVIPEALQKTIINDAYPQGDFHRIYAGQILATYADENAAEKLMP